MPSHTHSLNMWIFNGVTSSLRIKYGMDYKTNTGGMNPGSTADKDQTYYYNGNTGGNKTHNNIQPYITVYMWKRIS